MMTCQHHCPANAFFHVPGRLFVWLKFPAAKVCNYHGQRERPQHQGHEVLTAYFSGGVLQKRKLFRAACFAVLLQSVAIFHVANSATQLAEKCNGQDKVFRVSGCACCREAEGWSRLAETRRGAEEDGEIRSSRGVRDGRVWRTRYRGFRESFWTQFEFISKETLRLGVLCAHSDSKQSWITSYSRSSLMQQKED